MTSYYNTEVTNHTIKIGTAKFTIHEPLLELLPVAVFGKKEKEYDLTKFFVEPLIDALEIRYYEEFEVDPRLDLELNSIIVTRVVICFNTIMHFMYGLKISSAYGYDYPDIFLDSLSWMIDYLGINDTIYSLSAVREFMNDAKLFYERDMLVSEREEVEKIISSFLQNEDDYIETMEAIETIIRKDYEKDDLHILSSQLREAGYFYLAALIDMETVDISTNTSIFPNIFYNKIIENYTIIPNYKRRPIEDEENVYIIHSPFIGYNSMLLDRNSLTVNYSSYIVSTGLQLLYKFFLKSLKSNNGKLAELISELEIPDEEKGFEIAPEDIGEIYFFLKDLDIYGQYKDIIEAFIISFKDINVTESRRFGKTRIVRSGIPSPIKTLTLQNFDEKTIDPTEIDPSDLKHLPYFVNMLRNQKYDYSAAMYDSAIYNKLLGGIIIVDEKDIISQREEIKQSQRKNIEKSRRTSKNPQLVRKFRRLYGFLGKKSVSEITEEEEEPRISREESSRKERRGERGESLSRTSQRRSRSRSTSRSRPVLESKRIVKVEPLAQKSSKTKKLRGRHYTITRSQQPKIKESSSSKRKAFSTKPIYDSSSGSELEEEVLLTSSRGNGSLSRSSEESDD